MNFSDKKQATKSQIYLIYMLISILPQLHTKGAAQPFVGLQVSSQIEAQFDPSNVIPKTDEYYSQYYQKKYREGDLHPDDCTSGPNYLEIYPPISSSVSVCGHALLVFALWFFRFI